MSKRDERMYPIARIKPRLEAKMRVTRPQQVQISTTFTTGNRV
jgi:hypothetical protein